MKHIKEAKLNEKDFGIKEIEKDHIDKVVKIQDEITDVFVKNECNVNEAYIILAAMLETILEYTILKDLGYEE